jgi:hypothetical protein
MELTSAEIFLGVWAIATTYLWQRKAYKIKAMRFEVTQAFLALHNKEAELVVKENGHYTAVMVRAVKEK